MFIVTHVCKMNIFEKRLNEKKKNVPDNSSGIIWTYFGGGMVFEWGGGGGWCLSRRWRLWDHVRHVCKMNILKNIK